MSVRKTRIAIWSIRLHKKSYLMKPKMTMVEDDGDIQCLGILEDRMQCQNASESDQPIYLRSARSKVLGI